MSMEIDRGQARRCGALALIALAGLAAGVFAPSAARAEMAAADVRSAAGARGLSTIVPRALAGDASAAYDLGRSFTRAGAQPEDLLEAARWYLKAAQMGHARAQSDLGMMLAKGRGVTQDYVRAYAFFDLAAAGFEAGARHDRAIEMRDMMAAFMSPMERALARALAATWRAEEGR